MREVFEASGRGGRGRGWLLALALASGLLVLGGSGCLNPRPEEDPSLTVDVAGDDGLLPVEGDTQAPPLNASADDDAPDQSPGVTSVPAAPAPSPPADVPPPDAGAAAAGATSDAGVPVEAADAQAP